MTANTEMLPEGTQRPSARQAREHAAQRFAWIVLALGIALAGAGLFGGGPIAHTKIASPDGSLTVHYDRFVRYDAPSEIEVEATAQGDDALTIYLSRGFSDAVRVEHAVPSAAHTAASPHAIAYTFNFEPAPQRPRRVVLRVIPQTIGALSGTVTVGAMSVRVSQFVYP